LIPTNGEVSHLTGGAGTGAEQVTGGADSFMWFVLVLALVFAVITVITALRKSHEE
jgi:hypothetical protein